MMRLLLAILLAVECGHSYKARREPGLSVDDHGRAIGSRDNVDFRIDAGCTNSTCRITVDILNLRPAPLHLAPDSASLASACERDGRDILYRQGTGASNFEELEKQASARTADPYWLSLPERAILTIPPRGFVRLSYPAGIEERSHRCAPYNFRLRTADGPTIAAAFTTEADP
jgi:hypothetical protein